VLLLTNTTPYFITLLMIVDDCIFNFVFNFSKYFLQRSAAPSSIIAIPADLQSKFSRCSRTGMLVYF